MSIRLVSWAFPSRRRSWAAGIGCQLSLAALAVCFAPLAAAPPARKNEQQNQERIQPPAIANISQEIEDALQLLAGEVDPDPFDQIHVQIKQAIEDANRALQGGHGNRAVRAKAPSPTVSSQDLLRDAQLGIMIERPDATLVDQLDLPQNQSLVIREVTPDSPAARAGLKTNDILMELGGKAVSNDPAQFSSILKDVKPGALVDALVMRKGRLQTVMGLTAPADMPPQLQPVNVIRPGVSPQASLPESIARATSMPRIAKLVPKRRTGPTFMTRREEGSLTITLTGTLRHDGLTTTGITIQDGDESNEYDSIGRVPEKYRAKVKEMVEAAVTRR